MAEHSVGDEAAGAAGIADAPAEPATAPSSPTAAAAMIANAAINPTGMGERDARGDRDFMAGP